MTWQQRKSRLWTPDYSPKLAGYPCCCDETECTYDCGYCASSVSPCYLTVEINGIIGTGDCAVAEGVHELASNSGSPCMWWKSMGFLSPGCNVLTRSIKATMTDKKLSVVIQFLVSSTPLGCYLNWVVIYEKTFASAPDCTAWSDLDVPYVSVIDTNGLCTGESTSTCSVTSGQV